MSLKRDLEKEIQLLEAEIQNLEVKRSRSQASLIEAIISRRDPDESEVEFFRNFTNEIDVKRERLITVKKQLDELA